MKRFKEAVLTVLEFAVLFTFILFIIYVISGGFTYSHVKIFNSRIAVNNVFKPLLFLSTFAGILLLLKHLWKDTLRLGPLRNPAHYLIISVLLYNFFLIPSVLFKYHSFEIIYAEDLTFSTQAMFNTIMGHPLMVTAFGFAPQNWNIILIDHFSPFLLLLTPIFYFFQNTAALLIIQVLFISIGALPVYYLSLRKLGSKWISLAISIIYLFFPLIIKSLDYGFRAELFAMVFLLYSLWALEAGKLKTFITFLILALLCKENVFFAGIMIGLYIIFKKNHKIPRYYGFIISFLCLLLVIFIFMTFMAHGEKDPLSGSALSTYSADNIKQAISIEKLYDCIIISLKHFMGLVRELGYVCLFSPVLFLNIACLMENIMGCYLHSPHYVNYCIWHSILFVPFLFMAYIFGINNLLNLVKKIFHLNKNISKIIIIWAIGIPLLIGTLNFSTNVIAPFVKNELKTSYVPDHYNSLLKILEYIPENGNLFAMDEIASYAATRKDIVISFSVWNKRPDYLLTTTLFENRDKYERIYNEFVNSRDFEEVITLGEFTLYAKKSLMRKDIGWYSDFSDISDWEISTKDAPYKYHKGIGGLFISTYFDGNSYEDEFVQIREKIKNGINLKKYPYFDLLSKIEDTKVQLIEIKLGVDIDKDGKIDTYISSVHKKKGSAGTFETYRINFYEVLKEQFPSKDEFSVYEIELYPHKRWHIDCSKIRKKGWYNFWIKNITFFNISIKEPE